MEQHQVTRKTKWPNRAVHLTTMPSALLARRLRSSLWCQKQVVAGDSGRWATMNKSISIAIVAIIALHSLGFATEQGDGSRDMSLFESTNVIRKFLSGSPKYNYSDKRLTRVSLEYCEEDPQKGFAYVYFFNNRGGRIGGELTIYHFMDGKIFERGVGP